MPKLLVTGSAGMIASTLVEIALDKGYDVHSVDAMIEGSDIKNLHKEVDFKQIRVEKLTKYHLQDWKIDGILHLASLSCVDTSIKNPRAFEANVNAASNISWIATQLGLRLININTDEVYGSFQCQYDEYGRELRLGYDEDQPLNPSSAYAASKASADLMALSYFKTFGSDIICTRCDNNYGIRQQATKLIPRIVQKVLAGEPIPIFKTPALRSWLDVRDHCEALLTVFESGKAGEVYNISGGQQRSPQDIADLLAPGHPQVLVEDRKGYDLDYRLDASKIERTLGWKPRFDVDKEVPLLFNWYKENQR